MKKFLFVILLYLSISRMATAEENEDDVELTRESANPGLQIDISIVGKEPHEMDYKTQKTAFEAYQFGNLELAAKSYQQLADASYEPALTSNLIQLYNKLGDYKSSLKHQRKLIENGHYNKDTLKHFLATLAKFESDIADQELDALIAGKSDDVSFLLAIGNNFLTIPEPQYAVKFLKEAYVRDPSNVHVLYGLAVGYDKLGEIESAAYYYHNILMSPSIIGSSLPYNTIHSRLGFLESKIRGNS